MTRSGFERFEHDPAGYRQVLQSDGVAADLLRRANNVKTAVDGRLDDPDWDVVADVQVGRNRAGAMVSGVPMRVELDERILGSAIDAAAD